MAMDEVPQQVKEMIKDQFMEPASKQSMENGGDSGDHEEFEEETRGQKEVELASKQPEEDGGNEEDVEWETMRESGEGVNKILEEVKKTPEESQQNLGRSQGNFGTSH